MMDEPDDHAIAVSIAQAVEADAELIAALIREDEQARRDFQFARQLDQNQNAIAEADNAVDHIGLDDETYRTLQAFNLAVQPTDDAEVETELNHEDSHDAMTVSE